MPSFFRKTLNQPSSWIGLCSLSMLMACSPQILVPHPQATDPTTTALIQSLPPSHLMIAGATSVIGADCTGPYNLVVTNSLGVATATESALVATLSGGSGSFYSDANCANAIATATVPAGSSLTQVYYKNVSAETTSLQATTPLLSQTPLDITVSAPPLRLVVTGAVTNYLVDTCQAFTVQVRDYLGNPVTQSTALSLTISLNDSPTDSTPKYDGWLHSDTGCSVNASSLTIPAGQNSTTLSLEEQTAGNLFLWAVAASLRGVPLALEVQPDVAWNAVVTGPTETFTGQCTGPYRVYMKDIYDNPTHNFAWTTTLTFSEKKSAQIYSDSQCQNPLSTPYTLSTDPWELVYYMKDMVAEEISVLADVSLGGDSYKYTKVIGSLSPPTISIAPTTEFEGCQAVFVTSLSGPYHLPVTVSWQTMDGTAASPARYQANSGTLTIPAGQTTGAIPVALVNDGSANSGDTFQVQIYNPQNATLGTNVALGTIMDRGSTIAESATALNFPSERGTSALISNVSLNPDQCHFMYLMTPLYDGPQSLFLGNLFGTTQYRYPFTLSTSPITPFWNGDGSRIIYSVKDSTGTISYLDWTAFDGSHQERLTPSFPTGSTGVTAVSLSPDKSTLLYRVKLNATDFYGTELYTLPTSGGTPQLINDPVPSGGCIYLQGFSTDSSQVVFIANQESAAQKDLHIRASNGSGSVTKLNGPVYAGSAGVSSFRYSANSARIVYISPQDSATEELYSVLPNGTGRVKLNAALAANWKVSSFQVSPDGTKVAYLLYNTSTFKNQLKATTIDGTGTPVAISPTAGSYTISSYDISADSQFIAYSSNESGTISKIYSNDFSGSTKRQLTTNTRSISTFSITSNASNSYLMYRYDATTAGRYNVYKINFDGTNALQITTATTSNGGGSINPVFFDNSTAVLFQENVTGTAKLYRARFSPAFDLVSFPSSGSANDLPIIVMNGQYVLYTSSQSGIFYQIHAMSMP